VKVIDKDTEKVLEYSDTCFNHFVGNQVTPAQLEDCFRQRLLLFTSFPAHDYYLPRLPFPTALISELVNSTSQVLTKKKRGPKPKKISKCHFNSSKIKPKSGNNIPGAKHRKSEFSLTFCNNPIVKS